MARSVHLRRFVAVLLCCVLAFHQTLPVARAAEPISASLAITAGAIALGGLSAAAVESTIGPQVAAIIGTTMQGLGTSVYTAEDSALTKTKFIMSKIAVWCVQAKMAKEDFYRRVAEGVTVAANGTIQLTHDASKLISQFISWVYTQGTDTVVPEIVSEGKTASIGDYNFSGGALQSLSSSTISFPCSGSAPGGRTLLGLNFAASVSVGSDIFVARTTDSYLIMVSSVDLSSLSLNNRRINYFASGGYSNWLSFSYSFSSGGMYVYATTHSTFSISSSSFPLLNVTYSQFKSSISGKTWEITDSLPSQDVFVGQESTWDENKDLLNPAIDDVTTLTPDLINKLIDQLADGQTATMDIATYLDSLVDAFDGLKAQVAEITDAVTGIQDTLAVPDSLTSTVTNESEDPDSEPGYEPEKVDPPGVVEGLRYPLKDYFPFCIPFDLYALFQIFNAEPVAPAFTIDYTFPVGNGIPIHINVDLSDWDSLASTVRFLEVVSFIVGLAVATRRLFIRV